VKKQAAGNKKNRQYDSQGKTFIITEIKQIWLLQNVIEVKIIAGDRE
jgi:hypothetical protein